MLQKAITLAALAKLSFADVALYGQCGGLNYTGDTTCVAVPCLHFDHFDHHDQKFHHHHYHHHIQVHYDYDHYNHKTFVEHNQDVDDDDYHHHIHPFFLQRKFTLNGSTYTLVGSNAYWLAQFPATQADLDQAFADIAATGATTVRTWGFNDVTSASGTYYQIWNGATPTINYGSDGLAKFDQVVASAKSHGLKLIVALTNNWSDYGGMDVYVKQILGSSNHDLFYTDSSVIQAFKNYIAVWVNRYKNEPTILAWYVQALPRTRQAVGPTFDRFRELANEPRCKGSTVSIGDEGFGLSGDGTYPYT
ncbi:hypothetical protein FRC00_013340 [Tulasnella sp. 408]|nr:hypothetical protein FRC00_013340 [Tulasnella sp. 408]